MSSLHSIVGTWKIPSSTAEGTDEFMHINAEGRIVHFVYADASRSRLFPMMLWSQPLDQDHYRIASRPGHSGWTVRMFPTATGMTIDRPEAQFDLVPASEAELPDWYAERLRDAFSRMSQDELAAARTEQPSTDAGSSGKPGV